MKALFDKLSESYANTYSLTDHFDVDEIIWSANNSYLQRVYTKNTNILV